MAEAAGGIGKQRWFRSHGTDEDKVNRNRK